MFYTPPKPPSEFNKPASVPHMPTPTQYGKPATVHRPSPEVFADSPSTHPSDYFEKPASFNRPTTLSVPTESPKRKPPTEYGQPAAVQRPSSTEAPSFFPSSYFEKPASFHRPTTSPVPTETPKGKPSSGYRYKNPAAVHRPSDGPLTEAPSYFPSDYFEKPASFNRPTTLRVPTESPKRKPPTEYGQPSAVQRPSSTEAPSFFPSDYFEKPAAVGRPSATGTPTVGVNSQVPSDYFEKPAAVGRPSASPRPTEGPKRKPPSKFEQPAAVERPTSSPTIIAPSSQPSQLTSPEPTEVLSSVPTSVPTTPPSPGPSGIPTSQPTELPTLNPTSAPTLAPSQNPTDSPTIAPTETPTTEGPTETPTFKPTEGPTTLPTQKPTGSPTTTPTGKPSTDRPTETPTLKPTDGPTTTPSHKPTGRPTIEVTYEPTEKPSNGPTGTPTLKPTNAPTATPSQKPTDIPTIEPTNKPTATPSQKPTDVPTVEPTNIPTKIPTIQPTSGPTGFPSHGPSVASMEPSIAESSIPTPTQKFFAPPKEPTPNVPSTTEAPTSFAPTKAPICPLTPIVKSEKPAAEQPSYPTFVPTLSPTCPTEEPEDTASPTTVTVSRGSKVQLEDEKPAHTPSAAASESGQPMEEFPTIKVEYHRTESKHKSESSVAGQPGVTTPSETKHPESPSASNSKDQGKGTEPVAPSAEAARQPGPATVRVSQLTEAKGTEPPTCPDMPYSGHMISNCPSPSPEAGAEDAHRSQHVKIHREEDKDQDTYKDNERKVNIVGGTSHLRETQSEDEDMEAIAANEMADKQQSRQLGSESSLQQTLHEDCIASMIVYEEDFEPTGAENNWTNGIAMHHANFTRFLGPLGGNMDENFSQTFFIADGPGGSSASTVTIEFVLYTMDDWEAENFVDLLIGESLVRLSHLGSSRSSSRQYYEGSIDGISWWQSVLLYGENLGFGSANDAKHLIELTVQADHFQNNSLFMLFQVEHQGIVAGIDDMMIEANFNCSMTETSENWQQPKVDPEIPRQDPHYGFDADDDDGLVPYCESEDFPCGVLMVYVCHFTSSHQGFRTLCIHEANSHILQYYVNDYCGPCIGGKSMGVT
ncbi:laminin G sub domain 2 [Seminavis robusta]|uniref:Laminin G sub domain 2 n=1 Tax=Seminavis robusta TaxID=568900 RepID=A0A9N8DH68_9STRA|nr:laminin G sub domain 2 [Seminavis robusta]|eukprot:Sro119_g058020.1 laminin G sub domain 2 (1094) ;mRNA; r:41168-44449